MNKPGIKMKFLAKFAMTTEAWVGTSNQILKRKILTTPTQHNYTVTEAKAVQRLMGLLQFESWAGRNPTCSGLKLLDKYFSCKNVIFQKQVKFSRKIYLPTQPNLDSRINFWFLWQLGWMSIFLFTSAGLVRLPVFETCINHHELREGCCKLNWFPAFRKPVHWYTTRIDPYNSS